MNLQKTITLLLVTGIITFVVIEAGCCGKKNQTPKQQSVVERIKDAVSNIIHGDKKSKDVTKKCDENCACDADCICFDDSGNKCSCSQTQGQMSMIQSAQSENVQESVIAENSMDQLTENEQKEDTKTLKNDVVIDNVEQLAEEVTNQTAPVVENVAIVVDEIPSTISDVVA